MAELQDEDDIAIIGMSCRVAGAHSTSQLWDHLISSKDVQSNFEPRFSTTGYYNPDGGARKGMTNVKNAYLIDQDLSKFDAAFFSISPLEAASMDPQQRLLLELAYETIENSGIPAEQIRGSDTGVFTGISGIDYAASLLRDIDTLPKYTSTGISNALASNRISYAFDLSGPNFAIDTACSSSMVALHQARLSLQAKECGMAIVCGANLILAPDMFVHMSELGILSPNGRCRSFDIDADGYARGEGVVAIMLKPLKHALRDNDAIRAVLRGTGINQDGKTQGITQPSKRAQILNMQQTYRRFHVDARDVQYLEAHGTGTRVGDATEVSAISSVYSAAHEGSDLVVGSIKSNIGHLEASAALAGIVKVVESLERALIPPQMNLTKLNPDLECNNILVPTKTLPWPTSSGVRRAAINSFGYGGTNGHAILESYPKSANEMIPIKRPLLLKVSAASKKSLKSSLGALARYIEFKAPKLQDLAYTLLARRSTFNYTTFLTANTPEDLLQKLKSDDLAIQSPYDLCHSEIGFVFTGQGSQWPGMGSTLIKHSPLFARVIAACDQVLQSLPDAPEWHIAEELSKKEDSQVYRPEFSQPLCTVIQLGLIQLWESLSITPQMVVGHSSGEIGAAFAAGFLSLRDAVIIAYYRGYFIRQWYANTAESRAGAMCAVGMREEDCLQLLAPYRGRVDIAAINSPTSCTISGDLADVDDIVEVCKERGTFCRKLRVDAAYHSHHMLRLAASYKEALVNAGVTYKTGRRSSPCTMYSSVYSRSIIAEECTPEYWMKNLVSTVRFAGALTQAAVSQKLGVIIEIGPHPALKGPAEDTLVSLGGDKIVYLSSCVRGKDDYDAHLDTVSQLILAGIPMSLATINSEDHIGDREAASAANVLTDLPPYCWDHSVSHWGESRVALKHRNKDQPRHELLGTRISFDNDLARTWRNHLSRKELSFLHGLKDYERHLRPSLFVMMAVEAARQIRAIGHVSSSAVRISKLRFPESISLFRSKDDETIVETHFLLRQLEHQQTYAFEISASSGESHGSWKNCCTGEIVFSKSNSSDTALSTFKKPERVNASAKCQLNAFYPLECVEATSNELNGQIAAWQDTSSQYSFDPILLNSLFATIEACFNDHLMPGTYLLQGIESIEFPAGDWRLGEASLNMAFSACGSGQGKATCRLEDYSGQIITAEGLHFSFQPDFQEEMELGSLFLQPQWRSDLALQKPFDRMSISTFLQLLSHKWPMCDIGLLNVGESISNSIIVEVSKLGKRAPYRSITVVDSAKATQNNKIRYVDDLDDDLELDLLFSKSAEIQNIDSKVKRDGFVCVDAATPEARACFSKHFIFLGQIDGLQGNMWLLGKPKVCTDSTTKPSQLKVVATCGIQSQQFHQLSESCVLTWEQLIQQESSSKAHQSGETFDLIVFDYDSESNLLASTGAEILPRIQLALDRVGILLWVTKGALENPFNDVAGSLLRTIANEHPTMKCASICVEDTVDVLLLGKYVKDTYNSLLNGSREGEFKVRDGSLQILRYLPNDKLSASVGLTSPIKSTHTTGQAYHEVSILSPLRPELLVDHNAILPPCHKDEVLIEVEMSAIDHLDVMTFLGQTGEQQERPALGMFCAGFVSSSDQTHFDRNTRVVAWQPGAHRSELTVPLAQLRRIPQELNSAQALALYAANVTASAALHHHARVRPGDTVRFDGTGLLTPTLRSLCHSLGVDIVEDHEVEADFTVQYEPRLGLTVNGRSITQKDYLRATKSDIPLITSELEISNMLSQVKVWSLSQLRLAFEAAQSRPYSTILDHRSEQRVEGSILRYKPNIMKFRPDGTYVVLGGLGGLGRFLCQWMIQNGARHIVTISRSGSGSNEAMETIDAIEDLGGKLEAVQADASKQEDLQAALSQIRRSRKIYGCVNMAMVVDDGPFAKMQPNQWDRVLEAKVQTSWNLHQATMDDDLDFFIMFSSLASVLGNRMQSNYAVGNAFQNSLARYRRASNLPGVAVALGPMTEIGVLSNDNDLIRTYVNSGLRPLTPSDFVKLFEGALIESRLRYAPGVIGTGMAMFPSINARIQCKAEQTQIFWSGMPEFSHLFDHCLDANNADQDSSIKEQLSAAGTETGLQLLTKAFLKCLSGMLGLDPATTDTNKPLSQYGLDSLNALSCRYWFFQELGVDMTIFDILGCRSINELISRAVDKFFNTSQSSAIDEMPVPTHNPDCVIRPLSHSQKRLWFLQNVMSDKTALNLLLVCHIKGSVDLDKFQAAWSLLLARHEVLRSKIVETECGPQQVPLVDAQFNLAEIRADDQTFEAESSALKKFATAYEFDLEAGELVRGWLLRSQSRKAFFLASHHLAWDRQSAPTAFEETSKIYRDLVSENPPAKSLDPVPYQFVDYALWQQSCLEMDSITIPHIDYWKEQLAGAPEAVALLPIATSPDRPSEKQDCTGNFSYVIPPALSDSLRSFCAEKATTPFMFMASAISIAMYRLTGDADVVLGIPDGDRGHSDFDSLIGFTVNMLPIRCKLEAPDMSYNDYLEHYRRTCLEAYEHRVLPFDMLIQELDLSRQSSHNPLFQITVNYQIQGAYPKYDHGTFEMVDYEHYNAKHQTDLSLDIEEYPDGSLKCDFEFDSELYTLEGVKSFAETYVQLISSVIEYRGVQEIGEIRIVPDAHLQTIANSLHPPITDNPLRDQSALLFNELFEKAVIKHEEKEALVDSASAVSYKSLHRLTNRVANSLLLEGIETGTRVAIMCQPSILMVLAIYGALRAGCVYVPIDADSPVDRLKLILDDVDIKHAIVDSPEYSDRLVKGGVSAENIFFIAHISSAGVDEGKPTLTRPVSPDDGFCCIFTSGSTGRPKGIEIRQRQLRLQMEGYNDAIGTSSEDRILLSAATVFDMSLPAIFGTILHGATMCIASSELRYSAAEMVDFIIDQQVSSCVFTPTQLKFMLTSNKREKLQRWQSLKSMVVGGEALTSWLVHKFYNLELCQAVLYDGYGPTEATVANSIRRVLPEDADSGYVAIGGPTFPAQFYILDKSMTEVPLGFPGELYIGGPTVSQGYIKREVLSQQVFVDNIFASEKDCEQGYGTLYRSGDCFSLDHRGLLRFHGRVAGDRQVKIRGKRTELNEIENVIWSICQSSSISKATSVTGVAILYHQPKGADAEVLISYLAIGSANLQLEDKRQLFSELRKDLAAKLPIHMTPSICVFVPELPSTVTGKMDYKRIQTWDVSEAISESDLQRSSAANGPNLPPMQLAVSNIWQRVLQTDTTYHPQSDFFALGGHSLLLFQIQTEIKKDFGVKVSIAALFGAPTIEKMTDMVHEYVAYISDDSDQHDDSSRQSCNSSPVQDSDSIDGPIINGHSSSIDWQKELSLPLERTLDSSTLASTPASVIALTGASKMIGAYILRLLLPAKHIQKIYCLAEEAADDDAAYQGVIASLIHWKADRGIPREAYKKLTVLSGSLRHETLGLDNCQIDILDRDVQAIYNLAADVSLFKNYTSLRAGNVGCLRFLINLAASHRIGNVKQLHHLSTWGVSHLQSWTSTQMSETSGVLRGEEELSNMSPGPEDGLGYLKTRWACEALLYRAAELGLPVSIYRSCLCSGSRNPGVALDRSDTNRRTIAGFLAVGMVPDFGSAQGGGMSWISADYLAGAITFLANKEGGDKKNGYKSINGERHGKKNKAGKAKIYNVVSDKHHEYAQLCEMLNASGRLKTPLRLVEPKEWFAALRALGTQEMIMHADVLESWWDAGWTPFGLKGDDTLDLLRQEARLKAPHVDGNFLLDLVVGSE